MAENDVYIEGGNWPSWALEVTQQGILRATQNTVAINATSNQILSQILSAIANSNDARAMNGLVASAKKSADAAEQQAKEAARMADQVEAGNDEQKSENERVQQREAQSAAVAFQQMSLMKQAQFLSKYRRADDQTKIRMLERLETSQQSQVSELRKLAAAEEKYFESNSSFFAKWGSGGYVGFQESMDGFKEGLLGIFKDSNGRSMWSILGSVVGGISAAAGVLQGFSDFALGQVESRFDMAQELRRMGMFESLDEVRDSFSRIALNVNEAGLTYQEASEFTRQFSKTVGVIGVYESMNFIKTMATARGMMNEYGMTYPEVAYMGGMYLETLQTAGLLEQMNAQDRERGMSSFMRAVEGTALTMKVSLEEAAEIIKSYASREDISAIAAFNPNISEELRNAITFMGSTGGPIGEAVAMALSTGENFVRTQEFENIYGTTAGQTIAPLFENMLSAIRANPSDVRGILAEFIPAMRENMMGSDIVRMEVFERDAFAQSMVSSLSQLVQVVNDMGLSVAPALGGVDQAQLDMIRAERTRGVQTEEVFARVLQDMTESGGLLDSLGARTAALQAQTEALSASTDALSTLVSGGLNASIQLTATANKLFFDSITEIMGLLDGFLSSDELSDARLQQANTIAETAGVTEERRQELANMVDGVFRDGLTREERQQSILENPDNQLSPAELRYLAAVSQNLLPTGLTTNPEYTIPNIQVMVDPVRFGYGMTDEQKNESITAITSGQISSTISNYFNNESFAVGSSGGVLNFVDEELENVNTTLEQIGNLNGALTPEMMREIYNDAITQLNSLKSESSTDEQTNINVLIGKITELITRIES